MNTAIKGGVILGVLCGIWTLIMGFTGWYKHPVLLNMFWIVILIQIAVLVWGLRKTGAAGAPYWGQVGSGILLSVVAAIIIFCFSLLFTVVLFPNYFTELQQIQTEMLRAQGKNEEQIAGMISAGASMQTPFMQALSGAIGTIATGAVVSLIIGVFTRKK